MAPYKTIGFIGLGVMGEPICRNLVKKSGAPVTAFDLSPEPLRRLLTGPVGPAFPASLLRRHPDLAVHCDAEAVKGL